MGDFGGIGKEEGEGERGGRDLEKGNVRKEEKELFTTFAKRSGLGWK